MLQSTFLQSKIFLLELGTRIFFRSDSSQTFYARSNLSLITNFFSRVARIIDCFDRMLRITIFLGRIGLSDHKSTSLTRAGVELNSRLKKAPMVSNFCQKSVNKEINLR